MFIQTVVNKLEVIVHLLDPQPLCKCMCIQLLPQTLVLVHAIAMPRAYAGSITNGLPLIVESGASVCITPRRENFTFYCYSKVKIKNISKSNTVVGKGFVCWKVRDKTGKIVNLNLPGYHIPNAEV